MTQTRRFLTTSALGAFLTFWLGAQAVFGQLVTQTPLPGNTVPQFVEAVPTFVGSRVNGTHPLTVNAMEFQQKILPASMYTALPAPFNLGSYVWGYKITDNKTNVAYGPNYPAFTVEARRYTPTSMTFINSLNNPVLESYLAYDQTIHWAAPTGMQMMNMAPYTGPIPTVTHLHGGEVPSAIDGGPNGWFTANNLGASQYTGSSYNATINGKPVGNTYVYPNTQEPATLWFHDHSLGATRLNVFAGLEAFYFLRGGKDTGPGNDLKLPAGPYEVELAIQDRSFDTNGQLLFPNGGINPSIHPFWIPEFFGDVIVVNGKSWPYMNVEPRRYRLRILNGANARFFGLNFQGAIVPQVWQIGTDGGLLDAPVAIAPNGTLLIAPGERVDLIVDFSNCQGQTLTWGNNAPAPYPTGDPVDTATTAKVMQFRVGLKATTKDETLNPGKNHPRLREKPMVKLSNFALGTPAVVPDVVRRLTLNEIEAAFGPELILVNNTKWEGALSPNAGGITELPMQGATELWEIINTTMDAHPIHLHLVQFQVLNRQAFSTVNYQAAYDATFPGGLNPVDNITYPAGVNMPGYGPPSPYYSTTTAGYLGGNPDPTPFLVGAPIPADSNEYGWKDTFKMYPNQVTRILVRFAPTDVRAGKTHSGENYFAFDPTEGPGYVWHCHIVDHEDNEMMRPFKVAAPMTKNPTVAGNPNEGHTLPGDYSLDQNYPNPFNPSTEISFSLPQDNHVTLRLFNALGQEVKTLVNSDAQAGRHTVTLDASALNSGVYYYKIEAGNFTSTRKMTLMK